MAYDQPINTPLSRWMAFLEAALLDDPAEVTAVVATELLYRFLGCRGDEKPRNVLRKAFEAFGIDTFRSLHTHPGSGCLRHETAPNLFESAADQFVFEVGPASVGRATFISAHELGHVVLHSLLVHPHVTTFYKDDYKDQLEREAFCNMFARQMLLPDHMRDHLTLEAAQYGLSEHDNIKVQLLQCQGSPDLTFQHLRTLANQHGISIRAIVSVLHRHTILNEARCAVAILRMCSNQFTGQEVGLRVWQAACPYWGYIIRNRRVARQGFHHAAEVFGIGKTQETAIFEENLLVKVRSPVNINNDGHKPVWSDEQLTTTCAYTPVDVKDEGRYLVAIWAWAPSHDESAPARS